MVTAQKTSRMSSQALRGLPPEQSDLASHGQVIVTPPQEFTGILARELPGRSD